MGYRVINGKIHFIGDFSNLSSNIKKQKEKSNNFSNILRKEINKSESFVISNHALERFKERNINFSEIDMKNINEGINKAEKKGCKECLILYKNAALITSIKNRTIITAVDKEDSKGKVFTNIDGTVII